MTIELNLYQTLAAAVAVFFLGSFLKDRVSIFRKYCIPAPVIGGTIFSIVNCILYTQGVSSRRADSLSSRWPFLSSS